MATTTGALTAPGIGSNLDVNGLVTQLMAVEKRPLTLMQQTQGKVQAKISAYGMLQSQIASFGDAAAALGQPSSLSAHVATIGDSSIGSVSAAPTAGAGSYALEVTQLAKPEKLVSGTFSDASAVVGTGDITISLGTYDKNGNTFTARADKTPFTLTLTSANNSLAGVRDAINAANKGVSATIVIDTSGARLVLSSADTGANNAIRISAPTVAALAYDPTAIGSQSVSELQTAQNAKVKIDNLTVESMTNQITGAIDGVTLNLAKANPGQPTNVSIAQDVSAATASLNNFVTAYNGLNSLVRGYTSYDATTKSAGALQGEVTAVSVQSRMRSLISGSIAGTAGVMTNLSQIGLSVQADGSLKLDQAKLTAATSTTAGFNQLSRLFVASSTNPDTFVTRFKTFVDKEQGTGGLIPSKTDGLNTTIKNLTKQQDDFNARMVGVEARMRTQFNALDANLASQNAITSYLTSQVTIWNNATKA